MKKRLPYIILIVGVLGLIGSLSYLFKNTTEPTGNKITQKNTHIEKSINNTDQSNTTNNDIITTNKETKENKIKNKDTLSIIMPGMFFNQGFIDMGAEIKKKEKLNINYNSIENLNDYKKHIQENIKGDHFDIMLIPTDWIKSLEKENQLKQINLSEDVINFVNQLFTEFLNKDYTVVPHALDPLVSFIAKSSNIQTKNLTMGQALAYLTITKTKNTIGLPVLRGISKNDIRLLEQNKETFSNYFSILYNLIFQFQQNYDTKSLDAMLQLSQFNSEQKRDYVKFILLSKKIQKRNQYCEIYPDICLFAYKFADIKFGYLSDIILWDKYFKNKNRTINDIDIVNFPISSQKYKIRGRVFLVNKNSKQEKNINTFFNYYLKAGVNNNYTIRNDIRSAHNAVFNFQKSQKKYQNIIKYEKDFSLIYAGRDLEENFLKNTKTIELLKGEITSKEYLNNLSWTW